MTSAHAIQRAGVWERGAGLSPRARSRLAGLFELLEGAASSTGQVFILGTPVVQSDAAATARNILAHGSLAAVSYSVTEVFFGFYAMCLGCLVLRSTFLPGVIGVLLLIDGLAYLVYSFADMLAPASAAHLVPWIQLPVLPSEGLLSVWLLAAGVDVERWWQRASTAFRTSPMPREALA